jgi:cysteine desulfurase
LILAKQASEHTRLQQLRDRLETALRARVPDVIVHGEHALRAPHISNVSIPGTDSESMLMALDLRGIACSAGSACQSGSVSASHVLSALGVSVPIANAALRLSLGCLSDDASVDRVVSLLGSLADKARAPMPAFD